MVAIRTARARRSIRITPELERIARTAPARWRTEAAIRRAGFRPVRGGLKAALQVSRLRRLSRELARARCRAKLTQAQVARRMGTTVSAISRMESKYPGNLTLATIQRFTDAVGAEFLISVRSRR